jgi:hypothetical protein
MVFAVENGRVELLSRQPVEMTVLPGLPLEQGAAVPEFAAELRGVDDQVLHRVELPNPLAANMEVFAEQGQTLSRAAVTHPRDAFTVVVPAYEDGDHVALVAAAPSGGTTARAESRTGEVIARFGLRDGKKSQS